MRYFFSVAEKFTRTPRNVDDDVVCECVVVDIVKTETFCVCVA